MDTTQQIITGSIRRRIERHVQDRNVDKLLMYLSPGYGPEIRGEVYEALCRIPHRAGLDALIECGGALPEAAGEDRAAVADALARAYESLGVSPLQIISDLSGTGLTLDVLARLPKFSNVTA